MRILLALYALVVFSIPALAQEHGEQRPRPAQPLASAVGASATGEGAHIDMALFDTQLAMLANQASNALVSGKDPPRQGNTHPNIVPYQPFEASDGRLIIAVGNDRQFAALAERVEAQIRRVIVGQDELVKDVLAGLFAEGHILLEGVPGLGKTVLLRTLGQALSLDFTANGEGDVIWASVDAPDLFGGEFSDSEKWTALSGGQSRTSVTEAQDLYQVLGIGPFSLGPGASVSVGVAMVAGADLAALLQLTREFHLALNEASNNLVLLRLLRLVDAFSLTQRLRKLDGELRVSDDYEEVLRRYREHRVIFEAVRSGDGERAEQLMLAHAATDEMVPR